MATKDKKIGKQTVKLENPPKIISESIFLK